MTGKGKRDIIYSDRGATHIRRKDIISLLSTLLVVRVVALSNVLLIFFIFHTKIWLGEKLFRARFYCQILFPSPILYLFFKLGFNWKLWVVAYNVSISVKHVAISIFMHIWPHSHTYMYTQWTFTQSQSTRKEDTWQRCAVYRVSAFNRCDLT